MTDYTTDYTPNSFNKSRAFDARYNSSISIPPDINKEIAEPGGLNKADIENILDHRIEYIDANREHILKPLQPKSELLIDRGNRGSPSGTNYDPAIYNMHLEKDPELLDQAVENPITNPIPISHTGEKFWLEDPSILFRSDNYYNIIPNKKMTRIETLNTLTRLFIYLFILCVMFGSSTEYVIGCGIGIGVIIILYFIQKSTPIPKSSLPIKLNRAEGFDGYGPHDGYCDAPTRNNPFMNVTMHDLMENRYRPPACPITDPAIKKKMNEDFYYNVFRDVDDVFNRKHSQRQFYTMPSTTIPNHQTDFARWLYQSPETCKENQLNCLKYEDVRYNRFNPNTDIMERDKEDLS